VKIETYLLYIIANASLKTHGFWTVATIFYMMKYIPFHAQICGLSLQSRLWLITHFKTKTSVIWVGARFFGRVHGCERQKLLHTLKHILMPFRTWLDRKSNFKQIILPRA